MRSDAVFEDLDATCVRAPAKINLNLHVIGRRSDGYHELSGLVVFADIADELRITSTTASDIADEYAGWSLEVSGPFADPLRISGGAGNNLVLKAARLFSERVGDVLGGTPGGHISLQKNLPVAAGIGGGSADAAATLNALQKMHSFPLDDPQLLELAVKIGADVPMCLTPAAQMISGIGEIREPVADFPRLAAVLVNPQVGVSTAAVFKELAAPVLPGNYDHANEPSNDPKRFVDQAGVVNWLQAQRNDLQSPASRLAPVIKDVIAAIERDNNCRLANMSGSGATCYGLYDCEEVAAKAAEKIGADHSDWWVRATVLN